MTRKKPVLSLRRPADPVNPQQAERFVRGMSTDPVVEAKPTASPQAPARLVAPPPDKPAQAGASSSKSLVYRKRTDDRRRRMTIYLSEDLSRRLRLYAAEQDQDYSVVLAEALTALLDGKGVP